MKKTHCSQGHEFTPDNTYHPPGKKHRMCRECKRNWRKKERLEMKGARRDKVVKAVEPPVRPVLVLGKPRLQKVQNAPEPVWKAPVFVPKCQTEEERNELEEYLAQLGE